MSGPTPRITKVFPFIFPIFFISLLGNQNYCYRKKFPLINLPLIQYINFLFSIVPGIEVEVNANNYRHFFVKIYGPSNTPYESSF